MIKHLPDTNVLALLVGVFSLILVLSLKRWLALVPGSLVVVILSILSVYVFGLDAKGVKIVGHIDAGLPALGLPHGVGWRDYLSLFGAAIGVLLIGFAEGLGAAKTYATRAGYEVNANRELAGLGAANLGSGLSSGMVVNGSLSKTAVNGGGRREVAGQRPGRSSASDHHAALLDRTVRVVARSNAGSRGDRCCDRARRHRQFAALVRRMDRSARPDLRARRSRRLCCGDGGHVRRTDLRHPSRTGDWHRGVDAVVDLSLLPAAHRKTGQTGERCG